MKAVLQRVKSASVTVDGQLISTIGKGILVFAAIGKDDTTKEAESMAAKVLKVKLWDDDQGGRWRRNVQDLDGEVLCGNKPDFHKSAPPEVAKELYNSFTAQVRKLYREDRVKDGIFQAMMDVALVNDGPVGVDYRCIDEAVTIEIETNPPESKNPTSFKDELPPPAKVRQTFELPVSLME